MAFRIGQPVVCVDASPGRVHGQALVAGRIYVISGFDDEDSRRPAGLYLEGVRSLRVRGWLFPVGWRPERFRPIVARKTDISALKALLVPGTKILEDV